MTRLGDITTEQLQALFDHGPLVALVPVGSVEPHGPHLPLATDTIISEAVAARAREKLRDRGIGAAIAPCVPYGVTDFARGFAGAISLPAPAVTAFLRAVAEGYLAAGFAHVCLINNHLEPAHDAAVRAAIGDLAPRASVACPLKSGWGRKLSPEYQSGACHAGRYETSLVLAAAPGLCDEARARSLAPLLTSLSVAIAAGQRTFCEMGLSNAYTGAPAEATAEEGRELLDTLAELCAAMVAEGLAA